MQHAPDIALIVARARNGVIGQSGNLPWRLRDDLAFFKATTSGAPIVMGRKTWESLPVRPLPKRQNLVMTRDWTYAAPGARVYSSIAPALNVARATALRTNRSEVFVIGGEAIYAATLPHASRLYITEVDAAPDGDAHFPEFDAEAWEKTVLETHSADARNDHGFEICRYDRRSAKA